MRSNMLWLLLSVVIMLGVAAVAQAEPKTRGSTPMVAQADGTMVAGLFRRVFDGRRCGPDGCPDGNCPNPEPDIPDDPPPVEKKPLAEEPVQADGRSLSAPAFIAAAVVGGIIALIAFIRKERG